MFKTVFFCIIGLLLLCAMNDLSDEIVSQNSFHLLPFLQLNILYFLFGILIQRSKVERILNQKSIQPNRLIIPAIILVAIAIIPNPFWTDWFGQNAIATVFFINPLTHGNTHSIIGVLSGFLFIKAIDT